MTTQQYFDEALKLEPGSKIMIPCFSKGEQESTRVQLFRLRNRYAKSIDPAIENKIGISKDTIDEKLFISLERRPERVAFIIKSDGSMKSLEEKPVNETLKRIVKAAIDDQIRVMDLVDEMKGVFTAEEILTEVLKLKPDYESEEAENGKGITEHGLSETD
jgi:hypothetical protein